MNESKKNLGDGENAHQYRFLSLYELIQRIADNADHLALIEFHSRPLFKFKGEENLTCTDFIVRCYQELLYRERAIGNSIEIADRAHNLTIDKFSNLYNAPEYAEKSGAEKNRLERSRSDCRLYFRAVLNHLDKSYKKCPNKGQLELEAATATAIQGFVRRHFNLSVKEAKRKANPLWSRYFWDIGGPKICVWLPVYLRGRKRAEWLKKNIGIPQSAKPGKRERIQVLINQKIGNLGVVPFNETLDHKVLDEHEYRYDHKGDLCQSLGEVVAREKAGNITRQRRAIRALGKNKLNKMVQHIFEKIADDDYHDIAVARMFGLSKATFSRFAGSRWDASKRNIPDLWLNTAQVLSVHPDFKETALEAGVWKQVVLTLDKVRKQKVEDE